MKLLARVKQFFCRHDFEQIAWRSASEDGVCYSEHLFRCVKCGREMWVDGRRYSIRSKADNSFKRFSEE